MMKEYYQSQEKERKEKDHTLPWLVDLLRMRLKEMGKRDKTLTLKFCKDGARQLLDSLDDANSRLDAMEARGIDTGMTRFSTSFGRGVDYYTGFEFELHAKAQSKSNGVEPLVAGGRYDGLMTQLGAGTPIPAVGFSVWIEALTELGRKPAATSSSRSAS